MNEQNIISELKKRNAHAFKAIYELYKRRLVYFADKLLNDETEATYRAIDTLIKLWKKCDQFETMSQVKEFLYSTLRDDCVNRFRILEGKKINDEEINYFMYEAEMLQELTKK